MSNKRKERDLTTAVPFANGIHLDTFEENSNSESDDDLIPQIDLEDSEGEDEEDDSAEEEDEDDEARLLRELAEEQELDRELANSEDEEADALSDDSSESFSKLVLRHTFKPDENFDGGPFRILSEEQKSALLGYDTRSFKDKGRRIVSEITGEEKWEWDPIEPGYGSESGEDEVNP